MDIAFVTGHHLVWIRRHLGAVLMQPEFVVVFSDSRFSGDQLIIEFRQRT